MKSHEMQCNHREQREEYLFGWLEEAEEVAFLKHLETCACCQREVEAHEADSLLLAPPPVLLEDVSEAEHMALLETVFPPVQTMQAAEYRAEEKGGLRRWFQFLLSDWGTLLLGPVTVAACFLLVHQTLLQPAKKYSNPSRLAVKEQKKQSLPFPRRKWTRIAKAQKKQPAFQFKMSVTFDFAKTTPVPKKAPSPVTIDFSDEFIASNANSGKSRVKVREGTMKIEEKPDESVFLAVVSKKSNRSNKAKSKPALHNHTNTHTNAGDTAPEIQASQVALLHDVPDSEQTRFQASTPALPAGVGLTFNIWRWRAGRGHSNRVRKM